MTQHNRSFITLASTTVNGRLSITATASTLRTGVISTVGGITGLNISAVSQIWTTSIPTVDDLSVKGNLLLQSSGLSVVSTLTINGRITLYTNGASIIAPHCLTALGSTYNELSVRTTGLVTCTNTVKLADNSQFHFNTSTGAISLGVVLFGSGSLLHVNTFNSATTAVSLGATPGVSGVGELRVTASSASTFTTTGAAGVTVNALTMRSCSLVLAINTHLNVTSQLSTGLATNTIQVSGYVSLTTHTRSLSLSLFP